MFKNSKISEKKYVRNPLLVPQTGFRLEEAMVLYDNKDKIYYDAEEEFKKTPKKEVHLKSSASIEKLIEVVEQKDDESDYI